MRRVFLVLIILLLNIRYSFADYKDFSPYASFSGGIAEIENLDSSFTRNSKDYDVVVNYDNAFFFSTAIGTKIYRLFRIEGEFLYIDGEIADISNDDGITLVTEQDVDYSIKSYMFNLFYDVELYGNITSPYIGAGIGSADFSQGDYFEDKNVFAYQLMAGTSFQITKNVDMFSGYRFFVANNNHISGKELKTKVHLGEIGLKVKF